MQTYEKAIEAESSRGGTVNELGVANAGFEQDDDAVNTGPSLSVVKNAVVDVWWLYDDGGLSMLVPHLLTMQESYLYGVKLNFFNKKKF
jgi:hypothetical protein